jgi:hypothetical protein
MFASDEVLAGATYPEFEEDPYAVLVLAGADPYPTLVLTGALPYPPLEEPYPPLELAGAP